MKAQTADVTRGCVPLVVSFEDDGVQNPFWDFGDMASSSESDPEHSYTSSGTFTVRLFEGQGGPLVGSIDIVVYPEIVVDITPDVTAGCIPLDVNFNSIITADNDIDIDTVIWTLGDGAEILGRNISHTYLLPALLDISVEVLTTPENCRNIFRFDDVIEAEDLNVEITPAEDPPCMEPSTFSYELSQPEDDRYSYVWDFGNGTTGQGYDPGPVTYQVFGDYDVSVTISSPSGCEQTSVNSIRIGAPIPIISFPDTICLGQEFQVMATHDAIRYEWTYGDTLIKSLNPTITHTFHTPGEKEIELLTYLDVSCQTDTTIIVTVDVPEADFFLEPTQFCSDTTARFLIATNDSYVNYIWNDSLTTNPILELTDRARERDSLHINVPDTIRTTLEVISRQGCTSQITKTIVTRLPEAFFIARPIVGLSELTVTFDDFSVSDASIVERAWDYGDGNTQVFTDSIATHSYTYERCGLFPVRLTITDAEGCTHTSKAVEIEVFGCPGGSGPAGPPPDPDTLIVEIPPIPDNGLCVGDSLIFTFFNTQSFDYHLSLDEDRFNHCWRDPIVWHQFNYPGTFTGEGVREYRGLILNEFNGGTYEILGASSDISFTKDCMRPERVLFETQSMNATRLEWIYEGEVISTAESFEFEFTEPGEHVVYHSAVNEPSGCPADLDSVTIHITELVADFDLIAEVCDSTPVQLIATGSRDVFASCHKGYRWEFEHQRPRETDNPILEHAFVSGEQEVSLIVEDINGCTDTLTKSINVFGIEPAFNHDSIFCLPFTKNFIDLTESDNPLVSWSWSFGDEVQNPSYTFSEADIDSTRSDTIIISLAVEDSFGCVDTLTEFSRVFIPSFQLEFPGSRVLCEDDFIEFFVQDSFNTSEIFDFSWDFHGVATSNLENPIHFFDEPGEHLVTMSYMQKGGGCEGRADTTIIVFPKPEACFTSDIDGLDHVCHPAQVTFFACDTMGDLRYEWQLGEDDQSVLPSPSNDFGAGTHTITLVTINDRTCRDTLVKTITLAGSSGQLVADDDKVCLDQVVTFDIVDTINIASIIWDFGDGNTAENVTPVNHSYSSLPENDPIFVKLILESEDGNCVNIDSFPISVNAVIADFENLDSLNICDGRVSLQNSSIGADSFQWEFDNGESSTEENPIILTNATSISVVLTAIDSESGCQDTREAFLDVPDQIDTGLFFPNLFSPNGDGNNDVFTAAIPESLRDEVEIRVFRIYNRWGQLVFDNQNPNGWTGIFEGEEAPPEVYAYYMELVVVGCDPISMKGNVTLVR